jgi:hypothetical protein
MDKKHETVSVKPAESVKDLPKKGTVVKDDGPEYSPPEEVKATQSVVDVKTLALQKADENKLRELLKVRTDYALEHVTGEELVAELVRRGATP